MTEKLHKKSRVNRIVAVVTFMTLALSGIPAMGKTIQITINDHNPEMSGPAQAIAFWAKEVEKRCNGKVKVNSHFGGVLLKGDEVYRGVQKGIADAGYYVLDRKDGFILNSVMTLPFMGWPDQRKTGQIYAEFLKSHPAIRNEWKGVIPLVFGMMPPTQIHNTKKAIRTPADLKGMKFHGSEYAVVQILAEAGATPIQMDISDMYMSLDRGLIDGVMNHFPVLIVFGVLKLLDHHTILGEGGINMTPMGIIWNEKSWNRLPADIKQIIEGVNEDYLDMFYAMDGKMQSDAKESSQKWNHETVYLTAAEKQQWFDLVKGSIHDKWIQQAEEKGLPGKATYNDALVLIKKYNQ